MTKHEIIVVTRYLGNNGADRVTAELIEQWSKDNSVFLWCMNGGKFKEHYPIPERIHVFDAQVSEREILFRLRIAFRLISFLRKHPRAIVIAFLERASLILSLCRPFINNKIIFSERNDPDNSPPGRFRRFIRDQVFHAADFSVFQTRDAQRHFHTRIQEKSTIIPNPVNSQLPVRYTGEKRKVIIAACRLTPQKNIPMLLDAFAMFSMEYPEYTLEIYGRGMEEASLNKKIADLNMDGNVFLRGFVDNIYDVMNRSSIYVSSSNYEGISNSMLEAMALGLPVIVTDCPAGGAHMVIQDGVNGLLVPVRDTEAMYRAMKRVIEEPGLAQRLGDEACKVRERFAIERIAKEWLGVLEGVVMMLFCLYLR